MTRAKRASFCQILNASPESFVHKALKDKQIECIHRIVCHGKDLLAVLPTGLGTAIATSKTAAELLVFCWLANWNGTFTKFCF